MNTQQQEFVDCGLCDVKLIGIPGGGKTKSIIEHVKANIGVNYFSNNEYIVITFSKMAALDFLNKGKKSTKNIKFGRRQVFKAGNVRTIHSLANSVIRASVNKRCSSVNTMVVAALNLLQTDKAELQLYNDVKMVYVDEAQDISKDQYDFIWAFSSKIDCFIAMVGDPNQNIYQFQGGSDIYLNNFPAEKTIKLIKNYRSTKSLIKFYNQVARYETNMITDNQIGEKPTIFSGSIKAIERNILREIKNYKGDLSEIAIMSPVKLSKFNYGRYSGLGLSLIRDLLEKNSIKYIQRYQESKSNKTYHHIKCVEGSVNLMTIHGSKGLEFNKVIVLNYIQRPMHAVPTKKEYNQFIYLWYVAFTRAKEQLTIYMYDRHDTFYHLKKVRRSTYTLIGSVSFKNKLKPEDENQSAVITDVLENIDPKYEYKFEELANYTVTKESIYNKSPDLFEHDKFYLLYGIFAEMLFEFYYAFYSHQNKKDEENPKELKLSVVDRIIEKIESTIYLDNKFAKIYSSIKRKLPHIQDYGTSLEELNANKIYFGRQYGKLKEYLECIVSSNDKLFYLRTCNKLKFDDCKEIKRLCQSVYNDKNIESLFKLALYIYQDSRELGFLWEYDFSKHIKSMSEVIENIMNFAMKADEDLQFQVKNEHPNLHLMGRADIVNKDIIIELKFCKTFNAKYIYQLLMYYNNIYPKHNKPIKLEIWNLYLGERMCIFVDPLDNYKLCKLICKSSKIKMHSLIFIYDLETTGLNTKSCQIIERHFQEYNLGFVPSTGLINCNAIVNKVVSELTGITTKMLLNGDKLSVFKKEMASLFKHCDTPKFIAHNGNAFDHPIMKRYKIFSYDTLCDDSKTLIRMLYNDQDILKKTLSKIYEIIVGPVPYRAHHADADVKMVIDILKKLNY